MGNGLCRAAPARPAALGTGRGPSCHGPLNARPWSRNARDRDHAALVRLSSWDRKIFAAQRTRVAGRIRVSMTETWGSIADWYAELLRQGSVMNEFARD